jgi:hypothetical protein
VAKKKAPSPPMAGMQSESDWRAHDDMHALKRAEEIMADKGRHRAARAEAKRQITHLTKVAGTGRKRSRAERLSKVEL